jgi:hypothetical protein
MSHALLHARIHGAATSRTNIAGCLSWCFADYNTHWNFGSGDRICYHGCVSFSFSLSLSLSLSLSVVNLMSYILMKELWIFFEWRNGHHSSTPRSAASALVERICALPHSGLWETAVKDTTTPLSFSQIVTGLRCIRMEGKGNFFLSFFSLSFCFI